MGSIHRELHVGYIMLNLHDICYMIVETLWFTLEQISLVFLVWYLVLSTRFG